MMLKPFLKLCFFFGIQDLEGRARQPRKCTPKTSCSSCKNKPCRRSSQCGRGGTCTSYSKKKCKRSRNAAFFDLIEETGPDMEINMEETDIDLDYGNICS